MKNFYIFCAGLLVLAIGTFVIAGHIQAQTTETQQTETRKTQKRDKFWTEAAQSGMAEVMMGNLALQKSQNEDVRRFAQMMVDDHTTANNELMTLAASKGVTLPTEVNSKQKSMADKLTAMTGTAFDMEYMKTQVKAHENAVKLFQSQANRGTDADVKAFAAKNLPTLQAHLEQARTISNSMKGARNNNSNNNMNGNSNMNSNDNSNMNMNRNSNGNTNRNSNMNGNSNMNRNSNMNMNSNTNSNVNMNSNSNMNR